MPFAPGFKRLFPKPFAPCKCLVIFIACTLFDDNPAVGALGPLRVPELPHVVAHRDLGHAQVLGDFPVEGDVPPERAAHEARLLGFEQALSMEGLERLVEYAEFLTAHHKREDSAK